MTEEARQATSFRLSLAEKLLFDRLGEALAPRGSEPLDRSQVLRIALRRLAEAELRQKEGGRGACPQEP